MSKRQTRSTRKSTGGRYRRHRKPRKSEAGGEFSATTLGGSDVRATDARGNRRKQVVKRTDTVNLSVDGETEEVAVTAVLENPADPDFVRRDILTKGALVETERGAARITSRPGQDGTVNAVLVDDED